MLAHRLLGGCRSNLSISCPSLVSKLIAVACAHLWSSFRQFSESLLFMHPETMVSCLLAMSRIFPGLPSGQLWLTSSLQAVFTQPTPVLSLGSDLRSLSLSSQTRLSRWVSRQGSQAGECWLALILCAGICLLCPLHPCCCTVLHGSDASPHPPSVSAREGTS